MASLLCSLFNFILGLLLAPFLMGIIIRVKSKVSGRTGKPLLQPYYDLAKLIKKEPVYPATTTWVFTLGPVITAGATIAALAFVPVGGTSSLVHFSGDIFVLLGFFALTRLAIMLSALDTGSAFEGMGTAREALFSALVEPVFMLFMGVFAYYTKSLSLSAMIGGVTLDAWGSAWPFFLLLSIALYFIMLTENARIPVDDPTTHLELTMIHEVMILDHSGPELALYEYAAALKLWIFGLIFAGLIVPLAEPSLFLADGSFANGFFPVMLNIGATILSVFFMVFLVGITESTMARLRLERVPQLISLAGVFVALAGLSVWRLYGL